MSQVTSIDGIYYTLRNQTTLTPLRSGKNGPNAHTTQTIVITAWVEKDGYSNSAITTATFLIHN